MSTVSRPPTVPVAPPPPWSGHASCAAGDADRPGGLGASGVRGRRWLAADRPGLRRPVEAGRTGRPRRCGVGPGRDSRRPQGRGRNAGRSGLAWLGAVLLMVSLALGVDAPRYAAPMGNVGLAPTADWPVTVHRSTGNIVVDLTRHPLPDRDRSDPARCGNRGCGCSSERLDDDRHPSHCRDDPGRRKEDGGRRRSAVVERIAGNARRRHRRRGCWGGDHSSCMSTIAGSGSPFSDSASPARDCADRPGGRRLARGALGCPPTRSGDPGRTARGRIGSHRQSSASEQLIAIAMRTLIVYESYFRLHQKIAEALAGEFRGAGATTLTPVETARHHSVGRTTWSSSAARPRAGV